LYSGCAIRSWIAAPVQRTETSPPFTLMVRSCGVDAAAAAGDGGVGVTVAGGAVAVAAGVGAAVRFWIAEGFAEAVGLGELPAV